MNLLKLEEIEFPIYKLRSYIRLFEEDNILYIVSPKIGISILDNRNLGWDTLSKRRIHIDKNSLYPLNKYTIPNIEELIHHYGGTFIDNKGTLFKYKKQKFYKIKYFKIKKIINDLLYVEEFNYPFKLYKYIDIYEFPYVGILNYLGGYIVYHFSKEKLKETRVKL